MQAAVGLDVTHRMLVLARQKVVSRRVSFVTGDMTALPFPDASFSVITTGYGLRNVPDLPGAIAFFASDDAAFVTGQVLSVSGGLTMAG